MDLPFCNIFYRIYYAARYVQHTTFCRHPVFTGPPQPAGHHQCAILQEACWSLASIVHWRVPGVGLLPSPSLLSSFGLHQVVAWRIV